MSTNLVDLVLSHVIKIIRNRELTSHEADALLLAVFRAVDRGYPRNRLASFSNDKSLAL